LFPKCIFEGVIMGHVNLKMLLILINFLLYSLQNINFWKNSTCTVHIMITMLF
jgi:hypothetical protein